MGCLWTLGKGILFLLGIAAVIIFIATQLDADGPQVTTFPGWAGDRSPYTPSVCLADPATQECLWWVSQRGDVWVPWESAVILPAGRDPAAPSGGHLMARDFSWVGPGFGLECASSRGFALVASDLAGTYQMNAMEVPCRAPRAEVYFPARVNIGSHVNQRGAPESALHLRQGYLQLPVHANQLPAGDCQWPKHAGRVALVVDAESGADTVSWRTCTIRGWE